MPPISGHSFSKTLELRTRAHTMAFNERRPKPSDSGKRDDPRADVKGRRERSIVCRLKIRPAQESAVSKVIEFRPTFLGSHGRRTIYRTPPIHLDASLLNGDCPLSLNSIAVPHYRFLEIFETPEIQGAGAARFFEEYQRDRRAMSRHAGPKEAQAETAEPPAQ